MHATSLNNKLGKTITLHLYSNKKEEADITHIKIQNP